MSTNDTASQIRVTQVKHALLGPHKKKKPEVKL